jgi:hypothetical protein
MDVEKLVYVNHLPEVTSPLYFTSSGEPYADGLFSYKLFGFPGSRDRALRYGYIKLDRPYLHPKIYKLLSRIDSKIPDLISGTNYYIVNEKTHSLEKVTEEVPNMGTGIEFLYNVWDSLSFKSTESHTREVRLELLTLMKNHEVFIEKQIVVPPFYRDVNIKSMKVDKVNSLYKKIITTVNVISSLGKSNFSYALTQASIQATINEIYEYFKGLLQLKSGFLHQAIMGKNIDYGLRTLISAPTFSANSWKELPSDYEHAAVPLSQCISGYSLAIQAFIKSWITMTIGDSNFVYVYDETTKTVTKQMLHDKWQHDWLPEKLLKRMKLFYLTPESRFDPVTIRCEDEVYRPFAFIGSDREIVFNNELDAAALEGIRYYTWTDLFFIAASDCTADKNICVTRYPVTSQHSHYFAGIKVRSTFDTVKMEINGVVYHNYPKVVLSTPPHAIKMLFIDSLEIFPVAIETLGADHDGDQVTNKPLYTYEANKWTDKYKKSLANMIGITGKSIRKPGDVATHSMYNLLRDPDMLIGKKDPV